MIVILNRIDNDHYITDYDNISLNIIRDYCFWLSDSGLLSKDKWIEYNFKITEDSSDFIKKLSDKSTIYLVKSLNTVISHITDIISHI
jgi:predicted transcriptional regulator